MTLSNTNVCDQSEDVVIDQSAIEEVGIAYVFGECRTFERTVSFSVSALSDSSSSIAIEEAVSPNLLRSSA